MQGVTGEIFRLRICGGAKKLRGFLQVVIRFSELDAGAEQKPIRSRISERLADAAGIHDARFPNHAVELHVGVTADDEGNFKVLK